jgi:ABC-type multidrug transport system fused ATPase/permease subunit
VTWLEGRFDLLVGLTIALGTAATLVVGVQHVQAGALTVGSLLVIMAYLTQIYEPLKTMSKKIADLQSGLASANRAFVLLDQVQEVIERPHSRPLSGAVGGGRVPQCILRVSGRPRGPPRHFVHREAGNAGGNRRPNRCRQDHIKEPAHAVLRSLQEGDLARRFCPARVQTIRPAKTVCDGLAGSRFVFSHNSGKYRLCKPSGN